MTFTNQCDQEGSFQRIRRILAQLLAVTIKNLILFDIGLNVGFAGIVIPALTGTYRNEHNLNETLSLTPVQASWLGSMGYVLEPLGCVLSAFMTDELGRRRSMLIVNIPFIIAWFMIYRASSVVQIFIAYALLGFGVGLAEAPIITYIGEITQASLRGVMIAYSSFTVTLGILFIQTLNTLMPWRHVGLACMLIPITTVIGLLLLPETPVWLLARNRTADAEKSLRWLRGWTTKSAVAHELEELQRYCEISKSCTNCIKQNQKCPHPLPTIRTKVRELRRSQTMKPFCIVISAFVIALTAGIMAIIPFNVQIFQAYNSPIEPDRAAALSGVVNNLGIFSFLTLLRFTGKRPLYLTMLSGVVVVTAIISVYGFLFLPSGYNSFDQTKFVTMDNKQLTYIPFICIILWNFFTFCGISTIVWQILSEMFPYKTRGLATAISVALNYALNFVATKSYYNLEVTFSLPGVTLMNCVFAILGWIVMYNILPETEGRSLADIEMHFSDKTKKITNHKIAKPKNVNDDNASDSNEMKNRLITLNEVTDNADVI